MILPTAVPYISKGQPCPFSCYSFLRQMYNSEPWNAFPGFGRVTDISENKSIRAYVTRKRNLARLWDPGKGFRRLKLDRIATCIKKCGFRSFVGERTKDPIRIRQEKTWLLLSRHPSSWGYSCFSWYRKKPRVRTCIFPSSPKQVLAY